MGIWDKLNRSLAVAFMMLWSHLFLEDEMICEAEVLFEEENEEEEEASENGTAFWGKGLMDARTILISDSVDHRLTAKVTGQLLFLDHEAPEKPIKIFINSPGGSVHDGFAIYDMIRFIRAEVKIISAGPVGQCGDGDYAGRKKRRSVGPAKFAHYDSPTLDAISRRGRRRAAHGRGSVEDQAKDQRDVCPRDRPATRKSAGRHGSRLLDESR